MGTPLALPTNNRLGWKGLPGTDALAYYGNPEIMAVISFMIQTLGQLGDKALRLNEPTPQQHYIL